MTKKILVWLLVTFFLANVSVAQAQQTAKIPRIGMLISGSTSTHKSAIDAFHRGLRELGYVEGKNVLIEYRYAEGKRERYPALAAEMVRLKPEVIVVASEGFTAAAKQATSTIPIVVAGAGDLVGSGLVASLAQPGGNITGSTTMSPDLSGKRLELLKEAVPKASRVAVLLYPAGSDLAEVKQTQAVAQALKVKIQVVEVKDPSEFQSAYAAMRRENANALILIQGSFTGFHRKELIELGIKNRLPTMCEVARWTEDGCLISYGPDLNYQWNRAAVFVDKILKGRTPADLPVEQPMKFEFIVNLKAAKQIGLTIPPNVLVRADRVIR
jgi:putative ABC transport system substrate-binding protein